ncbi:NAD(P)H-binding protein [Streptomyces sp. WI04-05B]|uniref:NAD(P)H-binding protein n=1 Tax=Streptomyces TaxID=1883 RepID=UPI0029B951DC|nr:MULTISPECIES: NAD(P)H-binding protein [unclassified Streptomyces]MDX2547105.1 NAD(P)H-binding protein [Streptomyces sp. WI04-05B]MDX2581928.1 NAD(P)H-binding protein [Streptomyces sp. WI04-05A]
MSEEIILVTGATGKTGRRVVRLLEERGVAVRAVSRSGLPSFEWTDPATWEPALRDVTGMYLVVPDLGSPQAARTIAAFARQAVAAGAPRAVLLSVPEGGADHEHVLAAERALEHAGLEWTVLRPRWFFQNFSEDFLLGPVLSGEVRLPAGDGKEAFVDAEDIAEVAVAALTEDGHAGWHYELSGPRLMTFGEAVAEIARATGRDIRYVPLTPEAYADEQRTQGIPEEWVQLSVSLYEYVRSGGLATLSDGVQRSLGRVPRDFTDYAKTTAAQGTWSA